ncbi:MAG: OPT/YSL family transporter, partial [Kiritimatiellae bacterium]|nr:OPT/YSL family transporter [Kiritimatiellia bacterium]
MKKNGITLRAFLVGSVFAAVFAVMTVYIENQYGIIITSTQIPVLSYLLLIFTVLLINPVCRLIRFVRAFAPVEIMVIFMMGMVSAGLSTFGLSSQIVPIAGSLFNSEWNNSQSEWNRYVVPYLNEKYFVSEPGIQAEAVKYKQTLNVLLEKKAVYEAARLVGDHIKMVSVLESELGKMSGPDSARADKTKSALANARRLSSGSLQQWQDLRLRQPALPDWPDVLRLLPPEIDEQELLTDEAEQKLVALEQNAFARAAVFRRGLPRNERSFPGILPLAGDDRRAYFSRLHRLIGGMQALRQMKKAGKSARALPAESIVALELAPSFSDAFSRATKELSALSQSSEWNLLKEQLDANDKEFSARRIELAAQLKAISAEKPDASRQRAFELADQSDNVIAEMKSLKRQYDRFKTKYELCHR